MTRPSIDSDPSRWSDRAEGALAEDLAGSRLRHARGLPLPPTIPFGRLRLTTGRRHRPAWLLLARVAVILIVGVGLGVAGGASGGWLVRSIKRVAAGVSSESRPAVPAVARDVAVRAPRAPEPPPVSAGELAPAVIPVPVEVPSAAPLAPARTKRALPERGPSPTAAPVLAEPADSESVSLSRALLKLRRDADPVAALALLDDHVARFPRGALRAEAFATRIEILLARGDGVAARAFLEGLPAPGVPLDRRLQVLRGELRVQAGDCAEAMRDFTQALDATPSDSLDERSLRGGAACAALSHDDAAVAAALDLYLSHFPDGPFAGEARLRLEASRK